MPHLPAKWKLCILLFLATTLNYLDRQTLGILAPVIQEDLALDNEALGWLFAAFYYSYTFAQFGVGGLLDRWNLRWAYGIGVLAWSAAAALTALATGFAGLLIFRLLLGLTESVNWPAAMRIVARSLPPHERSLGNGIFTSGTSVGALIAPAVILGIAASAGWRLFLVAILVNPCLYFLLNWLPTYFSQQHAVPPEGLTWILTMIFLGLDLGYLFCGAGSFG
jgi:MFS transporter, ACS family, hexuronate transporter